MKEIGMNISKFKNENEKSNTIIITEKNLLFEELYSEITEEFERISQKLDQKPPANNPISPNTDFVLEPDLLLPFKQLNVQKYNPKIFNMIEKLLPAFHDNLHIAFACDMRHFVINIRNIYNKIVTESFLFYKFFNTIFKQKLLDMINEWRLAFNEKKIKLTIVLSLKGFYLDSNKEFRSVSVFKNEYSEVKFSKHKDYSIFSNRDPLIGGEKKLGFSSVSLQFAPYCITAQTKINFWISRFDNKGFLINEEFNLGFLPIWDKTKEILQILALEGRPLKYGRPFYQFPWWISKKTTHHLNFPIPEWIDQSNFIYNQFGEGLVPDIRDDRSDVWIPKRYPRISRKLSKFLENDFIKVSTSDPLNPTELLTNEYFKENNIKGNLQRIQRKIILLQKENTNFNFKKVHFILNKLLEIGKADRIEDVILNTCLMFESIFLRGMKDELKYRLSLYASSLIANNFPEFEKEMDFIKALYNVRSGIIHGSDKWKKGKPFKKLIKSFQVPELISLYQNGDENKMIILEFNLKHLLYQKCCKIINSLIQKDLDCSQAFQKAGFLKFFLKNRKEN